MEDVYSTMPPAALTSILEVPRIPRGSAAELPPGGAPRRGYSRLWINYIHLVARGPDRTRYFLIPGTIDVQLSAACLHLLSRTAGASTGAWFAHSKFRPSEKSLEADRFRDRLRRETLSRRRLRPWVKGLD